MNERIEQLYSQVGLDFENFQRVTVTKADMEKFAELIVRECKDLLFESSENNRLPIAVDVLLLRRII